MFDDLKNVFDTMLFDDQNEPRENGDRSDVLVGQMRPWPGCQGRAGLRKNLGPSTHCNRMRLKMQMGGWIWWVACGLVLSESSYNEVPAETRKKSC